MHVLVVHSDPRFFRELKPLIVAQDATGAYLCSLRAIRLQVEAQFPDLIVLEHQCLVAGTDALAGAFRRSQRLPVVFLTIADSERIRMECVRTDGSMAAVDSQAFFSWRIPLPSMAEQKKVADALSHFDALVNDLSIGLPAELAARRKQYEYYRDKLLTFPEAS